MGENIDSRRFFDLTSDEVVIWEKNSVARSTVSATDGYSPGRRFTPVIPQSAVFEAPVLIHPIFIKGKLLNNQKVERLFLL